MLRPAKLEVFNYLFELKITINLSSFSFEKELLNLNKFGVSRHNVVEPI